MEFSSFSVFAETATTHIPYPYQQRIAEEGPPTLLAVPTGAGKTMAAVLPWLWRRRFHPDPAVHEATPHWLVLCLPMRVLTEQCELVVRKWLARLELDGAVPVHVVMGGEGRSSDDWRLHPDRDAIFVGTLDMLVSRALNRGYGASRFAWPIDFGLFNSGCAWVFDEIQLMGPALETSRQIQGLRDAFGTALPCSSMWMSATVPGERLETVDNPAIARIIELGAEDVAGLLKSRLEATKVVRQLRVDTSNETRRATDIAVGLTAAHHPGQLTVAVHNTIRSARATFAAIQRLDVAAEVVLLHSRFRPDDRRERELRAIEAVLDPTGPGRIVVTTQVLEAGVDLSASVLFTEAAPWPSVIQRAGRCNRDGRFPDAALWWAPPLKAVPYESSDVEATANELNALEGTRTTPVDLRQRVVAVASEAHAILRRRDLLGLFDTTPDLSGNDIDVSQFIRLSDDLDLSVGWRAIGESGPHDDDPFPRAGELCPAPVHEVRDLVRKGQAVWAIDHLSQDARWRRLRADEVRPGVVVVLAASDGGYTPGGGWDSTSRIPVVPVGCDDGPALVEVEEEVGDDHLSVGVPMGASWYGLSAHLADVEDAVRQLVAGLDLNLPANGLREEMLEAAVLAGQLHDIGKAHEVFQETLAHSAAAGEDIPDGGPWAKSGGSRRARHSRPNFRHELASALALLGEGRSVLGGCPEADLVRYLVAAHHGRVRIGIRSVDGDEETSRALGRDVALGVAEGDVLPEVAIPGGSVPSSTLSLAVMRLGRAGDDVASWTERALALLDRPDLGPFRLAFLEAIVRLADWRASAAIMVPIPALVAVP